MVIFRQRRKIEFLVTKPFFITLLRIIEEWASMVSLEPGRKAHPCQHSR
jgi:hypothetical protein